MTLHIMENITTPSNLQGNDLPRWMGKSQGNFSVKSTWNLVRQKQENMEENRSIWVKGIPFKMNFFLQKGWKRSIATYDNLQRIKINIVSRCWCCEKKAKGTMTYLFLTAPIAKKLLRDFAICAGINIDEMTLKHVINTWWSRIWTLWNKTNEIKHGGKVTFSHMIYQVQDQQICQNIVPLD